MGFIPAEIIKKKRDGNALTKEEIEYAIREYTKGTLPDYQMSALLMAIVLKGMSPEETHHLTQAMLHSGEVLSFSEISQYKVDKHSTGGVGDKTSLILAPIVACADATVPMISGRGLGHTGGTLDKLESIPGFSTQINLDRFRELLKKHGLGLIGQTKEICPADKKIYALRDVTGTVESQHLICASIMSKKLAEGIDGLVLDVKYGSGAFMKTLEDAEQLAKALIDIGVRGGKRVIALITDMNQPLGRMIGNSLEVEECLSILKQDASASRYKDCEELSLRLAGGMIWISGAEESYEDGYTRAKKILNSGKAYEKFVEICRAQGGNIDLLPKAKYQKDIMAMSDGFVSSFNNEGLGYASLSLGAGRLKSSDVIDPVAGIECHKKLGDMVKKGEIIMTLHASDKTKFVEAEKRAVESLKISEKQPASTPLIAKTLF